MGEPKYFSALAATSASLVFRLPRYSIDPVTVRVRTGDLQITVGEDPAVDCLGRPAQVQLDGTTGSASLGTGEDGIAPEERLLFTGGHALRDHGETLGPNSRPGERGVVDPLNDHLVLGVVEFVHGHHDLGVVVVVAVLGGDGEGRSHRVRCGGVTGVACLPGGGQGGVVGCVLGAPSLVESEAPVDGEGGKTHQHEEGDRHQDGGGTSLVLGVCVWSSWSGECQCVGGAEVEESVCLGTRAQGDLSAEKGPHDRGDHVDVVGDIDPYP